MEVKDIDHNSLWTLQAVNSELHINIKELVSPVFVKTYMWEI
jgi:hypothetical protein